MRTNNTQASGLAEFGEWLEQHGELRGYYATLDANSLTFLLLQADFFVERLRGELESAGSLLAGLEAREASARWLGRLAAELQHWSALERAKSALERVDRQNAGLSRARQAGADKRKKKAKYNRQNLTAVIDSLFTSGDRPGFAWAPDYAATHLEHHGKTFGYKPSTIKDHFKKRKAHHRKEAKK